MRAIKVIILCLFVLITFCAPAQSIAELHVPLLGSMYYAVASWYGHEFHGKQTASGQVFDMHDFTCAHRTLPFGSWLKITNIVNNKTTVCKVTDRGPFVGFRDLDVSYAVARVLDMLSLGTCFVRIEYVGMDASSLKPLRDFLRDHTPRKASQKK